MASDNLVMLTDGSFGAEVLAADLPVLVDFFADWCAPCRMMAPVLDELADEYDDKIDFVKLDVDDNKKTAASYGIMSIPTLLIFKNGEPVSQIVGARPKGELKQNLDTALE